MADEYNVPLYMQGKVIGDIIINEDTGRFSGYFEEDAMAIMRENMKAGVKSVTFESIFGLFAHHKPSAQERWSAYLSDGRSISNDASGTNLWSVYNDRTNFRELHNIEGEEEARKEATRLSMLTGNAYHWIRQGRRLTDND